MLEYKVVTLNPIVDHEGVSLKLTNEGREGWKVVAATLLPNSNEICYLLQRPLAATPAGAKE
jgi:hypothetical protein